MRSRLVAVCVLALISRSARADEPPAHLPPGPDPLSDPFFQPPGSACSEPGKGGPAAKLPLLLRSCEEFFAPCAEDPACPPEFSTWLTAEVLIGKARAPSLVPVVTTGPAAAGVLAGSIGQPGTVPLFGGGNVLTDWRTGLRVETGMWFDRDRTLGVGTRVYSLFSARDELIGRPDAVSVVNVPNFVPGTAVGTVQFPAFVGFPGITSGSLSATATSSFVGGDLSLRHLLNPGASYRLELLAGYRHMYLRDQFGVTFDATALGVAPALAPRLSGRDQLRTRNNFGGANLGLYASTGGKRFLIEAHASTALGVTVSDMDFTRQRAIGLGNGGAVPIATGLVALGVPALTAAQVAAAATSVPFGQAAVQNDLTYFGVVGEAGVRVKWFVTDYVRVTGGYSFTYWNNVRRAPEMFTNSPVLTPRAVDFTTHLFSAGLEVRY